MANWNATLTNLNYALAALYPLQSDTYPIISAAGIPMAHISFQAKAIGNWHEILREASNRGKVPNVIRAVLVDYPDNPALIAALEGELTTVTGPIIGHDLNWKEHDTHQAPEKIMGSQNTLLPISFLEVGLLRAKSVVRIRLPDGGLGSGFLIKDNYIVTNHHVVSNAQTAEQIIIEFNFQQSAIGTDIVPSQYRCVPHFGFATSRSDDLTIIRLHGDANERWGAIPVEEIDIAPFDNVNIIQHPSGGPKQIALYHNLVTYVDRNRVQYLTDTLPGSSGSPVFNSQWCLVAIHHSGGWILEPGLKHRVFRNEGISVQCLLEAIKSIA